MKSKILLFAVFIAISFEGCKKTKENPSLDNKKEFLSSIVSYSNPEEVFENISSWNVKSGTGSIIRIDSGKFIFFTKNNLNYSGKTDKDIICYDLNGVHLKNGIVLEEYSGEKIDDFVIQRMPLKMNWQGILTLINLYELDLRFYSEDNVDDFGRAFPNKWRLIVSSLEEFYYYKKTDVFRLEEGPTWMIVSRNFGHHAYNSKGLHWKYR